MAELLVIFEERDVEGRVVLDVLLHLVPILGEEVYYFDLFDINFEESVNSPICPLLYLLGLR